MAARKWGRKDWTYWKPSLYAQAAIARKDGDLERAAHLTRQAARAAQRTFSCS